MAAVVVRRAVTRRDRPGPWRDRPDPRQRQPVRSRVTVRHPATLQVNGTSFAVELEAGRTLLSVLRGELGLTGSKEGCDDSECGACMVLLDGQPVNSCSYLALQADGREVTTVEGLAVGYGAPSAPAGVPRARRGPVRLLHAGHADQRGRAPAGQPRSVRGRDPRRPVGQPLPLHRLRRDRRGRPLRGHRAGQAD